MSRLEDLSAGMPLPGIVTNITAFGAFVDVRVHGMDGVETASRLAAAHPTSTIGAGPVSAPLRPDHPMRMIAGAPACCDGRS